MWDVGFVYYSFYKSLYFEYKSAMRYLPCNFLSYRCSHHLFWSGNQRIIWAWSFSHFWLSFIEIEVLNEEEYSIPRILYCYNLQKHIILALCNNFDTNYPMFTYILLRNKISSFPKWCQKPTRPILCYYLVVNMEKDILQTLKIHTKLREIAKTIIFSQWWSG